MKKIYNQSCPYCRKGLSKKELEDWEKEKSKVNVEKIIQNQPELAPANDPPDQKSNVSIFNTSGFEMNIPINYQPGMVRDDSPVGRISSSKEAGETSILNQNSASKFVEESKEIDTDNILKDLENKEKDLGNKVKEKNQILEKRPSINMVEIQNDFDELEKMINTSHLSNVNESYEFLKKAQAD